MTNDFDFLIAHPGKHHVFSIVLGCLKSTKKVVFITPFYKVRLGRLLAMLPGRIGSKARGYFSPRIPNSVVHSPLYLQIIKIYCLFTNSLAYEVAFDKYVAKKISQGRYSTKVLITMQDYMPRTVEAARVKNWIIWSDQIINQSEETRARFLRHADLVKANFNLPPSSENNNNIIKKSDVITVPSTYCLSGIASLIPSSVRVEIIPYGATPGHFDLPRSETFQVIRIVARAHSFRKGGHLLLQSISECGDDLVKLARGFDIEFVFLGALESEISKLLIETKIPSGIKIKSGNIPNMDVPLLYQGSNIFLMPSLSEGMSLACMEAMHAGLPLIISKYCGIDGFPDHGMGYIIEDNVESLNKSLLLAFSNIDSWGIWGRAAKGFAKNMTWDIYEEKISKLCDEVLL